MALQKITTGIVNDSAITNVAIKVYLDDVATFIDLSRADTIAGVNALETAGILADGRANEILTNPITSEEEYIG